MVEVKWLRCRFEADKDDPRPTQFMPPGPYWITGWADDFSTVVAYVNREDQVRDYWPEAENIECVEVDEIVFTDRFPKPDWWAE